MTRAWLIACLLLPLSVAACNPGYSDSGDGLGAKGAQSRIGTPAPDFQLWNLDGNPVTLSSHKGRVVLLNFWATWCGPCRVEMPSMEKLYRQYDRADFEILAVSMDQQGSAVTRPFRDSLGLSFPILHDSELRVSGLYRVRSIPVTLLLDRQGIIVRQYLGGPLNWQSPEAQKLIESLIGARPEKPPMPQSSQS